MSNPIQSNTIPAMRDTDEVEIDGIAYTGAQLRAIVATKNTTTAAPAATQQAPAPAAAVAPAEDADGKAFRTAARLGLTLRMYGGCAQSSIPGSPSAYEVVTSDDPAAAMREAVARAEAVIAAGGEAQRLQQSPEPTAPTQEADGWMPIETAPKDGRVLLLGYYNAHGNWRTLRGEWVSADQIAEYWDEEAEPGWYETSVEAEDPPNAWATNPTHWRTMPAPAARARQEGGEA